MRTVEFAEDVRAAMLEAGVAKGFSAEVLDGCLAAIGRDMGREFYSLRLRPPGREDRRLYQKEVEALGLAEAVCEDRGGEVLVVRLRVEAFVCPGGARTGLRAHMARDLLDRLDSDHPVDLCRRTTALELIDDMDDSMTS